MNRELSIPLFLWVAAALVVHLLGGGGAQVAAEHFAEKESWRAFVRQVRNDGAPSKPVEVELWDESKPDAALPEEPPEEPTVEAPKPPPPAVAPPKPQPPKVEAPKPEPPKVEPPKPDAPKPDAPKPDAPKPDAPKPQELIVQPDRRISVKQNSPDEDEDNPDAKFSAERGRRVEQETQAQVRTRDGQQDTGQPKPSDRGDEKLVGSGDESQTGESEARPGDRPGAAVAAAPPVAAQPPQAAAQPPQAPPSQRVDGQRATEARPGEAARPDAAAMAQGNWVLPPGARERAAQAEKKEKKARAGEAMGLGSTARTDRGVRLSLSHRDAREAIGADQLTKERERSGAARLAKHRGVFKIRDVQAWRGAIENYVPNIQPGNQTALNAARVPFAGFIHSFHEKLHAVFAEDFLGSLDKLPKEHPMNDPKLVTHMEIVLDGKTGAVVQLGIVKTSGITTYDIGALEAVQSAGPYGVPPGIIVSPDGRVYLHWEFYREPWYACSTFFAHPFMKKADAPGAPQPVGPRLPPPVPQE